MEGGILYKELSYKVCGILFEVRKLLGPGHKEKVYCNLIEELLIKYDISYIRECSISIRSPLSNKVIGHYRPDFTIEEVIILEVKAVDVIPKNFIDQIYSYLRISKYELGIFVNFRSEPMYIKRVICTNDRKTIR
jgi:GxxExxY protein